MRILHRQYQPTQIYIRASFSSPAQASFFLVCVGDSVGAGYCPRVMPRPDVYIMQNICILFQEEISACVASHTRYVLGACGRVRFINLLPHLVGTSFLLVVLTKLNVSEPELWVTWSHRTGVNLPFLKGKRHRTGVNLPFLKGKRIQYLSVSA